MVIYKGEYLYIFSVRLSLYCYFCRSYIPVLAVLL
jgi:hypothetical protein